MIYGFYYDWESWAKAVVAMAILKGAGDGKCENSAAEALLRKAEAVESSIFDQCSGACIGNLMARLTKRTWFRPTLHHKARLVDARRGFTRLPRRQPIYWYPHLDRGRVACPVHKRAL